MHEKHTDFAKAGGICMIDLLVIVVVMSFLSFLFGHHIGEEAECKRRMK